MKKSTYILLGLLVVMLAVAYFIQRPTDIEDVTYSTPDIQLSLNPTHVVKIEIDRNKQYVRLERIKDVWKLTEPVHYEIDDEAIKDLLDGMAKFKIIGLVSSNPEKQKVFQVNEQGTSVIFTSSDGKSTPLIIGKTDANTKQTFVRPASSTSVYIAQGLTAPMVNKNLREWRQRTIYRADPKVVQLVSITSGSDKYVLRKRNNRWSTEEKAIPTNLVSQALDVLSYLRADDFVDTALIIDRAPKLHVEMMGQELLRLDIYPHGSNASKFFLKTSASQNIFVVGNAIAQELSKITEYLAVPPQPVAVKEEPIKPATKAPVQQQTTPITQQPTKDTKSPPTSPKETGKTEEEGELTVHTVKKGETMTVISKNYNVTVEQILKWNLLKSIAVKPGQELYIFVRKK
jgi:hypothetical protein